MQGKAILLPADLATPVGLVLHELATNAAKYGSLSVATGTVSVSWATSGRNNQRRLKLVWEEGGGPRAGKPKTDGFGNALIDSVIPGAQVERELRTGGLVCTIDLALPEAADDGAVARVQ